MLLQMIILIPKSVSHVLFLQPPNLRLEYLLTKYTMSSRSTIQFAYGLKKKNSTTLATYWLCSSIKIHEDMMSKNKKIHEDTAKSGALRRYSHSYETSFSTCLRSRPCVARHTASKTWRRHADSPTESCSPEQ